MEENQESGNRISIIMPVFNSEKYLREAIESIIAQNYKDWELIIVNDGSTDTSASICDEYALRHPRIKVVHIVNAGVSNARNVGLENSDGEYIVFCDSDDLVSPHYLQIMYEQIIQHNCDLVRCSANITRNHNRSFATIKGNTTWDIYCDGDLINLPDDIYDTVWGKVFRRSILRKYNISFNTNINRGEDSLFMYQYILACNKVLYGNIPLVDYLVSDNSLMRRKAIPTLFLQDVIKYNALQDYMERFRFESELSQKLLSTALLSMSYNLVNSKKDYESYKINIDFLYNNKNVCKLLLRSFPLITLKYKIKLTCILLLSYKYVFSRSTCL